MNSDYIKNAEKELYFLKNNLLRCKSISESLCCMSSIAFFNDFYYTLTGKEFLAFNKFQKKNRYQYQRFYSYFKKYQDGLVQEFLYHKSFLQKLVGQSHDLITSEKCIMDEIVNQKAIPIEIFSLQEYNEIIVDFLKLYHPEDLDFYHQMKSQLRFYHFSEELDQNSFLTRGFCADIYKNLPFAVICFNGLSVKTLAYFIHEFGHAVDFYRMSNSCSYQQKCKNHFSSFYEEVNAKFYERQMVDFCFLEGINVEVAAEQLEEYYDTLKRSLLEVYVLSHIPDQYLYHDLYRQKEKEIINDSTLLSTLLNCFDLSLENLDLNTSLNYSIGGLLGILLFEKGQENNEDRRRIHHNYLKAEEQPFSPSIFSLFDYQEGDFEKIFRKDFRLITENKK